MGRAGFAVGASGYALWRSPAALGIEELGPRANRPARLIDPD